MSRNKIEIRANKYNSQVSTNVNINQETEEVLSSIKSVESCDLEPYGLQRKGIERVKGKYKIVLNDSTESNFGKVSDFVKSNGFAMVAGTNKGKGIIVCITSSITAARKMKGKMEDIQQKILAREQGLNIPKNALVLNSVVPNTSTDSEIMANTLATQYNSQVSTNVNINQETEGGVLSSIESVKSCYLEQCGLQRKGIEKIDRKFKSKYEISLKDSKKEDFDKVKGVIESNGFHAMKGTDKDKGVIVCITYSTEAARKMNDIQQKILAREQGLNIPENALVLKSVVPNTSTDSSLTSNAITSSEQVAGDNKNRWQNTMSNKPPLNKSLCI